MKSNLSPHLSHPGIFTYKVTKAGHTLTHSAPISSSTTVVNISPPRTPVDGATGLVFSVHGLSRGKTAQLEVEFMLAALTCFGLTVKAVVAVKTYDKKFERAEFARLEYKKLRNLRRARAAQLGAGA